MKISTSYFYQIRNFKRNMIPVSTAIWDPRWFHTGNNVGEYCDKNGVWNGIRMPILSPINIETDTCINCKDRNPNDCKFLRDYKDYLNSLNFEVIYKSLDKLANTVKDMENFKGEPHIVLIVHETPDNNCSERKPLQEFFSLHGVNCKELVYPIKGDE